MRKLLALLFMASTALAGVASLFVGTGTPENTVGAGDGYFTGELETDSVFIPATGTAFVPDATTPPVTTGNTYYTGINTVATAITNFTGEIAGCEYQIICGSVAGGNPSTIADGGAVFFLEQDWVPATVGDSITLKCQAPNVFYETARDYVTPGPDTASIYLAGDGLIGVPAIAFTADANLGLWRSAANTLSCVNAGAEIWNSTTATGLSATEFNGPLGATAPAAITGTNYIGSGSMEMGQDFGEMFNNYRRTETIKEIDDFNGGVDATYNVKYVTAGVVGAGTNTVTVRDSWSELVTGGAGGPDMESTVTVGLDYLRAFAPRAESVVDLLAVGGQRLHWGFYSGAAAYAEIVYDTAIGVNWLLQVDDGGGVETIDSTIAVTNAPTKLEIVVTAAGVITWAIDDVPCTTVGLVNNMTAAAHSFRWMLTDIAAASHTVAVDYVEIERNKR